MNVLSTSIDEDFNVNDNISYRVQNNLMRLTCD